ncbi:MAG: glutathione S-transferase family protein [Candidatus Puniceispirillaceae bacterium]
MPDIIFHHYPQSPVAEKVRCAFGMKSATWQSVEIPRVPPKPLLMPLTGGYRRTPVAQIGADIYGDSQNIFRMLDEVIETPKLMNGLSMMMAGYCESVLFSLCVRLILTHAMDGAPEGFINDRGSIYFDKGWTKEQMKADLPAFEAQLQAGLSMIESHAAQNGPFLFGSQPNQADANLHYLLWFIHGRWDRGPEFLSQFPNLMEIEQAMTDIGHGTSSDLSAEQALEIAAHAQPQSPTGIACYNPQNLTVGDEVVVRQAGDTADPDITGRLRFLDETRISLDLHDEQIGDIALHLPVLGYMIKRR